MRIVLTGAGGQLGTELLSALSAHEIDPLTHADLEIADHEAVRALLRALRPELVVHTAAYTDVDGCERDPQTAYRVNLVGTENLALGCQDVGAAMLYISTNCIFDGAKPEPYLEYDSPNPISVYGASKLAGELAVGRLLPRAYVVRTSWLYGRGQRHLPARIMQLGRCRSSLEGVVDEIGSPTNVRDLAQAIPRLIASGRYGIYHLANEGSCSRYEMIRSVLEFAGLSRVTLKPIRLEEFPRASRPPAQSALANFCAATAVGIRLPPWRESLERYVKQSLASIGA